MFEVKFFVFGVPRPSGSKRGFIVGRVKGKKGKVVLVDTSGQRGKDWRGDLQARAMEEGTKALTSFMDVNDLDDLQEWADAPVYLRLEFVLPRPKYHYMRGKRGAVRIERSACVPLTPWAKDAFPVGRPDVLKLARAVEDALTGILWSDDAQIVEEVLIKRYGERPGVWVEVVRGRGASDRMGRPEKRNPDIFESCR